MFPTEIETERLRLDRLCRDTVDVFEYYELWASADERVYDHLSATQFETPKAARDELVRAEEYWTDHETATYAVQAPDASAGRTLVGRTSLDVDWDRRVGDLGIMLDASVWGRGYAGECGDALTELAFEGLDLGVVTLGHKEPNDRSRRAIEKFVERRGGQRDGVERTARTPGEVREYHRYSVTRAEYESGEE